MIVLAFSLSSSFYAAVVAITMVSLAEAMAVATMIADAVGFSSSSFSAYVEMVEASAKSELVPS